MEELSQKPRVLLVDDEDAFREVLARRLEHRGHGIRQASGCQEALMVLREDPCPVVVMDVKMPGGDGLACLERIQAGHPESQVILLTGHASTADGVAGIKAGAFDYLSKPVELEHLEVVIGHAFERVTARRRAAEESRFRAAMEQRLALSQRLAAVGTLATGVAHEINNPLAIISEAAGWLRGWTQRDGELSPAWSKRLSLALDKIETGVRRSKSVTHQLLDFARRTDWIIKEFDLSDLTSEVARSFSRSVGEAGVCVDAVCQPGDYHVWSDQQQVRQALMNLMDNAVKAVGQGGRVMVSVQGGPQEVTVSVSDDGEGIPQENLEKIFEPFFTTRPTGQGTGLGLAVSRGIVEKLGGRLEVSSRLGQGSSFTVVLPRKPSLEAGPGPSLETPESPEGESVKPDRA